MIYRKHGRSIRWENGTLVRVTECGWARESGPLFECGPLNEPASAVEEPSLEPLDELQPELPRGVMLERFIVTRGIADHEYGDVRWRDATDRVHVSLTRGSLRVTFDGTIDRLADVALIAETLAIAQMTEDAPPPRLRLAPNVTAALLPALIDVAPPNVGLVQTAGGVDGYGRPIEEESVNFYRPSYRVRPMRMPFNLRLECDVTEIEPDRPRAVALLGPIEGLVAPVLVRDRHRAWPARVRPVRIDAVARDRVWYPYGAGSFGAELML